MAGARDAHEVKRCCGHQMADKSQIASGPPRWSMERNEMVPSSTKRCRNFAIFTIKNHWVPHHRRCINLAGAANSFFRIYQEPMPECRLPHRVVGGGLRRAHAMGPARCPRLFIRLTKLLAQDMEERTWIDEFLTLEGNELFCEVDGEFIVDRFNLTGISTGGERLQDMIAFTTGYADGFDEEDEELDDNPREDMARHFYGLVHARYILTARGIQKMLSKYVNGDFGRCPRALCRAQPVVPIGLHDIPNISNVKLYCPKCEDIYHPKNPRQACLDGAYFGTSFPAMMFQAYPKYSPRHSPEQFVLKIFGFKIHDHAELARWQQKTREELEQEVRTA